MIPTWAALNSDIDELLKLFFLSTQKGYDPKCNVQINRKVSIALEISITMDFSSPPPPKKNHGRKPASVN